LSSREKVCLSWTARGKSSWEIGRILNISENTVNFHIKNALKKLKSNSRTLAAIKAIQLGIIEFPVEETSGDADKSGLALRKSA
jgi:LuxR family transcriptional regulator, activator of conjugal transfer of Ti plasmids